jgi:pheromone shutdown protein TraB
MLRIIDNIILYGSSHVQKDIKKELDKLFEKYPISLVALELDVNRFKSLMSNNSNSQKIKFDFKLAREIGFFGYLFAYVAGKLQKKIAQGLGIQAGIDMKTAYLLSKEKKIPSSLIDLDIKKTLKKISKLSFRKKMGMLKSILLSGFKKENKRLAEIDMKKLPSEKEILMIIDFFKRELPQIYKILIDDRNKHMSKRLLNLKTQHEGYILAVVGAAHVKGMEEFLEKNLFNFDQNSINTNKLSINFSINVD